jgi:iron complex outermembrane receptor protein
MSIVSVQRALGAGCAGGLLLLTLALPAGAQTGSISGKVSDSRSGQAVGGARVQAVSGTAIAASSLTREDGTYRLTGVAPGSYRLTVTRIGFTPATAENVVVTAGGTATADVQMAETATELNPVVTTVSRREEKALAAPASVAVVDVREVSEQPAVTVADHLEGLAGVNVSKGGVAQSNVVTRGFNNAFSGSLLTLQDYRFAGVPSLRVNVPLLFTSTNEDVERMEVLLGPASALYGPNSAQGVLHVITKSPFSSQGTNLTVDGGTRSLLRAAGRHAGLVTEKFAYKLSGEYFTAQDFHDFTAVDSAGNAIARFDPGEPAVFPDAAPPGRRGQANQRDFDIRKYAGELRFDIRPSDNSEFITTAGMSRIGSGIEYTGANGAAQAKNWTYRSLQQRLRIDRLFAQAFINFNDAGNDDSLDLSGTFLLRSGQPIVDHSRVFAAQIQHGFAPARWQDFVYGVDYINTNPRTGNTINGRNEDIDNVREIGGYVQSTTNLGPKWDFVAAVRVDNNDQVEGSQFSPRAAIVFKPTDTHNLRFTYNRAFGTPANFSFFLDLINTRNIGGLPYNIRAVGNPPKTGWTFRRDCTGGVGNLCMRTIFTGTAGEATWLPASAAVAYRGVIGGNAAALASGIAATLQAAPLNFPATQAQQVAGDIVRGMGALQPTPAQLSTDLRFLGAPAAATLTPAQVADIGPLRASYNNTYEIGYKGILGSRLRVALDLWSEKRGDVGNPAGLATPNVFFQGSSLQQFLAGAIPDSIRVSLQTRLGMSQAQATAVAAQLAPGIASNIATRFAPLPLGIVSFNNDRFASARDLFATYQSSNQSITIQGVDLAADFVATAYWTFGATYSWVSDLTFPDVASSNSQVLMLNAPDNKASLSARFRDESRGWGAELRGRYTNAYPVNSGIHASDVFFLRAGTAGTYRYQSVLAAALLDASFTMRLPVTAARDVRWTINGDNLLNHGYRTMPGMPLIRRLIVTRLNYQF